MASIFYESNLQQQRDCLIAETYKSNFFLSTVISINCDFVQVSFRPRVVSIKGHFDQVLLQSSVFSIKYRFDQVSFDQPSYYQRKEYLSIKCIFAIKSRHRGRVFHDCRFDDESD